jgi:3-hydroxyisobutyrate dehydrogenase
MLTDGPAVDAVMTGPDGALAAGSRDLVWAQMSTVGVAWTDRFVATAASRGVTFVDAPVSGSEGPAKDAQLLILASGPEHVHGLLDPVFDAMGRQTMWLGPAGHGNRIKLVLNNWLVDLVEATAETINLTQHLQLDPGVVLGLLESSPLGSPYALDKARTMLSGDFAPNFALKHALKDARLALDAARESHTVLPLTDALVARWQPFSEDGHGDDDVAAVYRAL